MTKSGRTSESDGAPPPSTTQQTFFLLIRAQGGDDEALNQICARYLPRLQRWASRRLPDGARGVLETGDLAQEILLNAIRRLDQLELRDAGAFHAYIRQAILFRVRDEARKAKRRGGSALEADWRIVDPGPSPLERTLGKDAMERYERALERLRPQDRDAIIARLDLRLSYEEVADTLGKPSAEAARKAVHRALLALAREMRNSR